MRGSPPTENRSSRLTTFALLLLLASGHTVPTHAATPRFAPSDRPPRDTTTGGSSGGGSRGAWRLGRPRRRYSTRNPSSVAFDASTDVKDNADASSSSPPSPFPRRQRPWDSAPPATTVPVTIAAASLTPVRFIRYAILAFAASEVLSFVGVFGDDGGGGRRASVAGRKAREFAERHGLDRRARRFRDEASYGLRRAREGLGVWWDDARRPGGLFHGSTWEDGFAGLEREGGPLFGFRQDVLDPLLGTYERLPQKSKFAVGAALGMISSRPIASLSGKALRLAALAYVTTEVTHSLGWTGRARRVDDFVNTDSVRQFASEVELEEEVDGAIRFVDRTLRDVDETIRDAAAGRGVSERKGIGRRLARRVDDVTEGYRRGVRRAMLHPGEGWISDIVEEHAPILSGLVIGTVAGKVL